MRFNQQNSPMICPVLERKSGFTLVEMMVSMSLLLLLLLVIFSATTMASKINKRVSADVVSFQEASTAFMNMTRRLSSATLNTYYDYHYSDSANMQPDMYIRQSKLHFVIKRTGDGMDGSISSDSEKNPTFCVFFQAPLGYTKTNKSSSVNVSGLNNALNACGYYIQFGDDQDYLPKDILNLLPGANDPRQYRYRFRLMEFCQPTEDLSVYGTALPNTSTSSNPNAFKWYTDAIAENNLNIASTTKRTVRPVADNIVALILVPKVATLDPSSSGSTNTASVTISKDYTYDSRYKENNVDNSYTPPRQYIQQNQLPPLVRVTMIAIDEQSAKMLQAKYGSTTPPLIGSGLFRTYDAQHEAQYYEQDLQTLTDILDKYKPKINYRVFTADIAIREAKWNTQSQ